MISFHVDDMHCGGCARRITQALQAVDPDAQVQVDLAEHRVRVGTRAADAPALAQALQRAGYTPRAETP